MLVNRILLELDAQLEKLQTARDTIALLVAPSMVKPKRIARKARAMPAAETAEVEAPPQPVSVHTSSNEDAPAAPAKRRGRPKGSLNRQPSAARVRASRPAEPTALSRAITAGPVFVSAAELERRRTQAFVVAAPPAAEVVPPSEGTLDALIREVAERRQSTAA